MPSDRPALRRLPTPSPDDAERWVDRHLAGLFSGAARASGRFRGGQTAADAALAALDITGYAKRRNRVDPPAARGASQMSPYIRTGLVDLPTVHDHPSVRQAPGDDRFKYRSELLWQEYSRHWYAVFGARTRRGVAYDPPASSDTSWSAEPWWAEMRCVEASVDELHADGWMVNQTRMWLASQWSVRAGADWREGEDQMFRHLLDGSRAANRLGWQWTVGASRNRAYGFSRSQVRKQAAAYCGDCSLRDDCPIQAFPDTEQGELQDPVPMGLERFGPGSPPTAHADAVWLTAESLGDADPALVAHPGAPVHFVFDEALLDALRLDGKRLVFLTETLADLSSRRELTVWRGDPAAIALREVEELHGRTVAVTHAPVPGFERLTAGEHSELVVHPWRWLRPATPALARRLGKKRFPTFRDWCRLTAAGVD